MKNIHLVSEKSSFLKIRTWSWFLNGRTVFCGKMDFHKTLGVRNIPKHLIKRPIVVKLLFNRGSHKVVEIMGKINEIHLRNLAF